MSKGKAFVISGPSGSGKDTIIRSVLSAHPEIKFSISCITRAKRGIPDEDRKYNFVSVDEFRRMLENGELLEYNQYVGNYYGTPRKPVQDAIDNGDVMIIEVDVNGAFNIKKSMPEVEMIFIMPPSMEVLEKRLRGRSTDEESVVLQRIAEAKREIECSKQYDYIVVNDQLEKAVEDVYTIICK